MAHPLDDFWRLRIERCRAALEKNRQTGSCIDCGSPDRICNTWCITEKCFPNGRIQIILINEDLGL